MTVALAAPARWFLASVATYMVPNGIQMVLLPYLMAIELNQSASRFGLTQMVGQLPLMLFLLVGGWMADRVDARRWLMQLQAGAVLMPLVLAWLIWSGHSSEWAVLAYAFAWGMVGAFSLPARDGLLKRVSGVNVQRMVTLAIGTQFATQMAGQAWSVCCWFRRRWLRWACGWLPNCHPGGAAQPMPLYRLAVACGPNWVRDCR